MNFVHNLFTKYIMFVHKKNIIGEEKHRKIEHPPKKVRKNTVK